MVCLQESASLTCSVAWNCLQGHMHAYMEKRRMFNASSLEKSVKHFLHSFSTHIQQEMCVLKFFILFYFLWGNYRYENIVDFFQ